MLDSAHITFIKRLFQRLRLAQMTQASASAFLFLLMLLSPLFPLWSETAKKKEWSFPAFSDWNYRFQFGLGFANVQYINDTLPESQPLSELGVEDADGDAELQYPNSHSGPLIQLAAKLENAMGSSTAFQFGMDLNFLPQNKTDQPLLVDTSFLSGQGERRELAVQIDREISYTYFSLMVGLSSYFKAINFHLSYYLRMPLYGFYSIKDGVTQDLFISERDLSEKIVDEQSAKGSITGRPLGLGFTVRRDLSHQWWGKPLSFSIFLGLDRLTLQPDEEGSQPSNENLFFYGIALDLKL